MLQEMLHSLLRKITWSTAKESNGFKPHQAFESVYPLTNGQREGPVKPGHREATSAVKPVGNTRKQPSKQLSFYHKEGGQGRGGGVATD